MKRSPLRRKVPMKRSATSLQRQAIRKVSAKGRIKAIIYSDRRKWFLAQEENQICPVMRDLYDEKRQTSQIHHRAGRVGDKMLDESTWLAVSDIGHKWIHNNVSESYKRGWMVTRH